jgi:DNA-binding protein H-NS
VKNKDLAMMSGDELWSLYEEVRTILSTKMDEEKRRLERCLARLNGRAEDETKARRPYPKVHPKYRNPERPSETWSGRGRQPRWVGAQLSSGKRVDDLLIARTHWRAQALSGNRIPEYLNCRAASDREASSSFVAGNVPLPFELRREASADRDNDLLVRRRKASAFGSLM